MTLASMVQFFKVRDKIGRNHFGEIFRPFACGAPMQALDRLSKNPSIPSLNENSQRFYARVLKVRADPSAEAQDWVI